MKTLVLGTGGWGTALAILLARSGQDVSLWGRDADLTSRLQQTRENEIYLPGVRLPDSVTVTSELELCANAELVLVVTPSLAIRSVAQRLAHTGVPGTAVLLNCSKGIEFDSGKRMTQILEEYFPGNRVAVLSGPSHAEEVARERPTAVVIGCKDRAVAIELQNTFSTSSFRAYTSDDVDGIELGGALKNIFALAAGVSDGLGLGDNSKAALVTRALAELTRLGCALGGKKETFQGLSGIGDLMVTCFSQHSRNRGFGERIGRGETVTAIQQTMRKVAEGVPTTRSAWQCARRAQITTPIIDQMYGILYEQQPPATALGELLKREPRPESEEHPRAMVEP